MMWIAIFVFFLLGGYFIYGKNVEKNWEIDIYRDQSAWQEDESIISHFGYRYVQLAQFAVFLSVEALLSAVMGYVYGLAYVTWMIVGTVFFGGALSYYGGMYALRNQGHTLNYIIRQKFGQICHAVTTILLLVFIAVLLSNSYYLFNIVYEGVFKLPAQLLMVYCAGVILFFSLCSARQMALLFSGVGIFAVFVLVFLLAGSYHQLKNVEYGAQNFVSAELKYAFPLMFFTVAMGSVNCLQGLQASILTPMIKNEKLGRKIFFGAAVFQGLFLILLNTLIAAWNFNIADFQAYLLESSPYKALQEISFVVGGKKAVLLFFALSFVLFLNFVGVMTRLARNLIAETKIGKIKFLSGIVAFLLVTTSLFFLRKYNLNISYVTIVTQLAGIFSCWALVYYLKSQGHKCRHLIWPAVVVFCALMAYVMLTVFGLPLMLCDIAVGAILVFMLVLRYALNHKEMLKIKWDNYCKNRAEVQKIKQAQAKELRQKKLQQKELERQEKERKIKQAEQEKREKTERKKQQAEQEKREKAERKRQKSLALMLKQDQTDGKSNREEELEKEILRLKTEKEEIERRTKEIESELEKEQSKRLLLETSESIVNKIEEKEEESSEFVDKMEKLDEELVKDDNLDIQTLINDDEPKKQEPKTKFDFDDDFNQDLDFESVTNELPLKSEQETKPVQNKKNRKRKNKKPINKNQAN